MNSHPDHDWALRRLTAFAAGLLSEQDTLRLDGHVAVCVDCRSRLASVAPPVAASAGHLPASLVATWTRATKHLSAAERSLVRSHLESCETCRATLVFAGHQPALDPVAHTAQAARVEHRHAGVPHTHRAWRWAFGFAGAAAAAAVWLIVFRPAVLVPGPGTSATMGGGEPSHGPSVTFESSLPGGTPVTLNLPPWNAGSPPAGRVLEVSVASVSQGLVLAAPPDLAASGTADAERRVEITLRMAGHLLGAFHTRAGSLESPLRLRSSARLAPGDYELRFEVEPLAAAAPAVVRTYALRIR